MLTRPATHDDLHALTALCQAYDLVELGATDFDVDDLRQMLALAGSTNLVAVTDNSAALLGFMHLDPEGDGETAVDPAATEPRSLQRALIAALVDDARGRGLATVSHWSGARPDGAGTLLAEAGFTYVRSSWRMHVAVDAGITPHPLPAGVVLRPFAAELHAKEVWAFVQHNFAGTFGSRQRSFDNWRDRFLVPNSDVVRAVQGDDLLGVAVLDRHDGYGYISQLAVDFAHRGRGIGLALLTAVIARNARDGLPTQLNVDGANDRALALYRGAGMAVDVEFRQWEKAGLSR